MSHHNHLTRIPGVLPGAHLLLKMQARMNSDVVNGENIQAIDMAIR